MALNIANSYDEYSRYLRDKFSYFNTSSTMEGIPTTTAVSPAFLKKCANDPEKARWLEDNLRVLPELTKTSMTRCLGTITSQSWKIDANGNMSATVSGTSDPNGRIAKENTEKKIKESKEKKKG